MQMVEPMLAKLTTPDVRLDGIWLSEPKYDGERTIAIFNENRVDLWSKRHIHVSGKFPEIVQALTENVKGTQWMLDGEMTVHGGFRELLKRNVEDKIKISILSKKMPATYRVFDVMHWDGEDLLNLPLLDRKKILLQAIHDNPRIKLVPFKEVTSKNVAKQFSSYLKNGFEGAVLKKADSRYEPGKRSGEWLKIKMGDTIDVNIIGATRSESSIPFGALMMEKDGKYFGKVGSGFSDQQRHKILEYLEKNQAPLSVEIPDDFNDEILITTKPLLAEIKAQEIGRHSPRAPVWVRFRWG